MGNLGEGQGIDGSSFVGNTVEGRASGYVCEAAAHSA